MSVTNRQKLENSLVKFLKQKNIDTLNREHHGRFRSVTFRREKVTDGEIKIYGDKFFLLKWQTGNTVLPFNGQEKFQSLESLKEFIGKYF